MPLLGVLEPLVWRLPEKHANAYASYNFGALWGSRCELKGSGAALETVFGALGPLSGALGPLLSVCLALFGLEHRKHANPVGINRELGTFYDGLGASRCDLVGSWFRSWDGPGCSGAALGALGMVLGAVWPLLRALGPPLSALHPPAWRPLGKKVKKQ